MDKVNIPAPPKPTSPPAEFEFTPVAWWQSTFAKLFFSFVVISLVPVMLASFLIVTAYREVLKDSVPPTHALELQTNLQIEFILIICFVLLVATFTALVVARNISKPIQLLMEAMRRVSNDDLDIAIQTNRHDELGVLVRFFNVMIEKLHESKERNATISRLKSEFVSIAAHQMRTPLSAIKWALRLLLDEDFGKMSLEQKQLLVRSYETNERLIRLVNDLLNVARIEEGKFGYNLKPIGIVGLLQKTVGDFEGQAQEKHITLTFRPLILETTIHADTDRLVLAFGNLIDNAIHYTPQGGQVTVTVTSKENELVVMVEDTGIGIPEGEKKRIFSRFGRASNAVRMHTDGTGLGLFIVQNIIMRHGGQIRFDSREGKGTTFFVSLPLRQNLTSQQEQSFEKFIEAI